VHEEWTDKLSEYLDDELPAEERRAVDAHLQACAACAAVLEDLRRVVARARTIEPRPPQGDLWPGIAGRIESIRHPRRFAFTLGQLAAAAVLLMAVSAGVVWEIADRSARASRAGAAAEADRPAEASRSDAGSAERGDASAVPVSFADDQYDAAVADLEKALKQGRGRLDASTIAIVEHNLQIIDQAIAQAREALVSDPANSYLSGYLVETRRRKLDLLRRAAALTELD
jgi:anti-sigma factor RsiW